MKRNIIIVSLLSVIVLSIIASCSFITPAPELTIPFYTPVIANVNGMDYFTIDTIYLKNVSTVDARLVEINCEYYHNAVLLHEWPDNVADFSVFIPGTPDTILDEANPCNVVKLYNMPFPFPTEVQDSMALHDWTEVNCIIYFTVEDDYGYGKRFTTSINYPIEYFIP